jgi:hypothetical protein
MILFKIPSGGRISIWTTMLIEVGALTFGMYKEWTSADKIIYDIF